jgi:glycosyltransferase involved in cell wall biosynthesis
MNALSTVVIACNEEDKIEDCLKSVSGISDEIVVVDSGSIDKTVEIARKYAASVIHQDFLGFVQQKRFAVRQASHDWILSLDADERASPELCGRIAACKAKGFDADAYTVNRLTWYLTGWFKWGGWYPDRRIRLFNKRKADWAGQNPHDYVQPVPNAKIGHLSADILHYTYDSLADHVRQIQKFSGIAAQEKGRNGERFAVLRLALDPAAKFIKTYLFERAFLAGSRGFVFSVLASFSVFLKYAKLWELTQSGNKE